ncbi:pseudouridine synthase [Puniceicoccaceae bacterium K14]|nr:pseudouridine synthase [Puniceicoccaceae bacterium K14]
MADKAKFISFPEGYLGPKPTKFPLLVDEPDYFAINKPAGMSCYQHDWTMGMPDVSMALKRELMNGKPQLARLGIAGVYRMFRLEAHESGVLMYAKSATVEEELRNACGSRQFIFKYHLLGLSDSEEREMECSLPVAKHFHEKRALVSHSTGKKCETRFKFLRNFGGFQLWEAETRDNRLHQVRLHAAESGIRIVGDTIYGGFEPLYLSKVKRGYRPNSEKERAMYDGVCIHLVNVEFDIPEREMSSIHAPLPSRFNSLLKRMEENRGYRP